MAKTGTITESILGVAGVIVVEKGTVKGSFGQILVVGREIFLFQGGIGCAKAGGVVQTFFKHVAIVALGQRNGPPTKQRRQGMNGGFTFTCTTGWAFNAAPNVSVAGRVVEVLVVATGGGGGPGRFGTGRVVVVEDFTFGGARFALLLAAGVLVLVGWADGASAVAGTVGA